MARSSNNYFSSTRITFIAMFATLSGVLYAFGFAIPGAFPSWLELNFSDIPVLIGTFALGPLSGAITVFVKVFIKLIIKSTSTVFVGELADLLIGIAFAVPAGLIYKRKRTFKGALIGLVVGTAASVLMSMLLNWLILVPFYVELFFGGSWDVILSIMRALFPACTRANFYVFYIFCSVLPFNVMRCLIATLVALPLYKRVSVLIRKLNVKLTPKDDADGKKSRKGNIIAVAVGCGVVLLLIMFALLRVFVF